MSLLWLVGNLRSYALALSRVVWLERENERAVQALDSTVLSYFCEPDPARHGE